MQEKAYQITTGTILKGIIIIAGFWLLYLVVDILAVLFLSLVFTATLDPVIDWLGKKKIPRPLGAFLLYVIIFGVFGLAFSFLIPPLAGQFSDFTQNLPAYTENLTETFRGIEQYAQVHGIELNLREYFRSFITQIFESSGELFSTTISVFSFFISVIIVLSLTFYMLVEEEGMKRFITTVTPRDHQEYALSLFERIHNRVGKWMFGQILLMIIIFGLSYAVLEIFNVPYALILAAIAGILEIIPYVGPIIATTLATLVGFFISPVTALIVLGLFILIQQIENHIIVPQVMKKAVGLNPVVVILALLVGAKLGGVLGAIIAVPFATALGIFVKDVLNSKKI